MRNVFLIFLFLSLTACLDGGGSGSAGSATNNVSLSQIMSDAGCSLAQLAGGIQFTCGSDTATISNGTNGASGGPVYKTSGPLLEFQAYGTAQSSNSGSGCVSGTSNQPSPYAIQITAVTTTMPTINVAAPLQILPAN